MKNGERRTENERAFLHSRFSVLRSSFFIHRPSDEGGSSLNSSEQTPDRDPNLKPGANGNPSSDEPIDDAQLSPRAWLASNGPTLLLVLAALVGIYYRFGL